MTHFYPSQLSKTAKKKFILTLSKINKIFSYFLRHQINFSNRSGWGDFVWVSLGVPPTPREPGGSVNPPMKIRFSRVTLMYLYYTPGKIPNLFFETLLIYLGREDEFPACLWPMGQKPPKYGQLWMHRSLRCFMCLVVYRYHFSVRFDELNPFITLSAHFRHIFS